MSRQFCACVGILTPVVSSAREGARLGDVPVAGPRNVLFPIENVNGTNAGWLVQVLLDKGANRLARNKKGRKPGDVFSPTVEDDKKERIKIMLGMGTADASAQPAAASTPAAASATSTAATSAVENGVEAARGTGGSTGGKGGSAGGSSYKGNGDVAGSTAGVPPPAYKVGLDMLVLERWKGLLWVLCCVLNVRGLDIADTERSGSIYILYYTAVVLVQGLSLLCS